MANNERCEVHGGHHPNYLCPRNKDKYPPATQEEVDQIVALMNELGSGYYPTAALELLRRLNLTKRAHDSQHEALATFGRFLFESKVTHFPEEVYTWRDDRDGAIEALAVKNGKLADAKMREDLSSKAIKQKDEEILELKVDVEELKEENERLRRERDDAQGLYRTHSDIVSKICSQILSGFEFRVDQGVLFEEAPDYVKRLFTERDKYKDILDNLLCWAVYPDEPTTIKDYSDGAKWVLDKMTEYAHERDSWKRAKGESDDTIKKICDLVPRERLTEDIFQAIKRVVSERQRLGSALIDLKAEVEHFVHFYGSWVEPNGKRHCNGLHTGHSLCKVLDEQR